jgi:hypothetical protein
VRHGAGGAAAAIAGRLGRIKNSSTNAAETGPKPPGKRPGAAGLAARLVMDLAKWFGIVAVSVIMGLVLAGLAQVAVPSMPMVARISIEIVGALIILRPMIEVGRLADTIERHHGKQFD